MLDASPRAVIGALALGLSCDGADDRDAAAPPVPAPSIEVVPLGPGTVAVVPSVGPVAVERLGDLEPPADVAPQRIGRPPPPPQRYPDNVGHFVIDAPGDVFVLDDTAGELVVQPGGDAARARVLARVPRTHGGGEQLFEVTVDATHAWFCTTLRSFDGSQAVFAIRRVPKTGGIAEVFERGAVHGGIVSDLRVDDAHVYWLRDVDEHGTRGGEIHRKPKAGGAAARVLDGVRGFYAWALDGDGVLAFVETGTGGRIVRANKDGGSIRVLAETPESVGALAPVAAGVVYTQRRFDPDYRLDLYVLGVDGGSRRIADTDGFPTDLVVDGDMAYWSDTADDVDANGMAVRGRPWRGDGEARSVAEGLPRGTYWTVVGGTLWWSTETGVTHRDVAR